MRPKLNQPSRQQWQPQQEQSHKKKDQVLLRHNVGGRQGRTTLTAARKMFVFTTCTQMRKRPATLGALIPTQRVIAY
jgi:hypothetical protein